MVRCEAYQAIVRNPEGQDREGYAVFDPHTKDVKFVELLDNVAHMHDIMRKKDSRREKELDFPNNLRIEYSNGEKVELRPMDTWERIDVSADIADIALGIA